jgi:hypothetical protein
VESVVALLMWVATDQERSIPMDDINKMALDVVDKWDDRNPAHVFTWATPVTIDSQALARLSKLIDIMMTHKDRSSKDPTATLAFMRRCVAAREEMLTNKDTAAEHVSKKGLQERQKRGTAAEPLQERQCYRACLQAGGAGRRFCGSMLQKIRLQPPRT